MDRKKRFNGSRTTGGSKARASKRRPSKPRRRWCVEATYRPKDMEDFRKVDRRLFRIVGRMSDSSGTLISFGKTKRKPRAKGWRKAIPKFGVRDHSWCFGTAAAAKAAVRKLHEAGFAARDYVI